MIPLLISTILSLLISQDCDLSRIERFAVFAGIFPNSMGKRYLQKDYDCDIEEGSIVDSGISSSNHIRTKVLWLSRFMLMSFALGAAAGVITSFAAMLESVRMRQFLAAFCAAGFCEELFKLLFPGIIPLLLHLGDDRRSIWLLTIVTALGFTTVENILYFVMTKDFMLLYIRSFLVIPMHASWNFIACTGLARKLDSPTWCLELIAGFILAVLLHGSYDYCIYSHMPNVFFLVNVLGTVIIASLLWFIRNNTRDDMRGF